VAFHLGFELPLRTRQWVGREAAPPALDPETNRLTPAEAQIIKKQIRKNAEIIHTYIQRLDLFVNQEKYPRQESFIQKIRERMFLLMEENDTFRHLLWRHLQGEVSPRPVPVAE